jgi:hypothetical protein
MSKALIPIVILAVLAGFGTWALPRLWRALGPAAIPLNGYIALGLGLATIALVVGGAVWLAFYSARKGYDDIDRKDS